MQSWEVPLKDVIKTLVADIHNINHILTWQEMPEGVSFSLGVLETFIGKIAVNVQGANDKIEMIKGHLKANSK